MTLARPALVLASASLLTLLGCSADPSSEPSATAGGPTDGGGGLADAACQELASASAQAQGDRVFVEAGGAQYVVDGVRPLPGNRVIVATTVDQPELVGYPQVQFLSQCGDGEVVLLGGYVPIDGGFELLFTTNEGSAAGDVPMVAP